MEAHALHKRGWSISAIARHLDRDRKTIRAYINGDRTPGRRRDDRPDPLAPYVAYVAARFVDDPHIWASALYDEIVPLGYPRSYVTFARQLRLAGLRPHCEACRGVSGRDTIEIDHPAGAEIQWDWFERRRAPWDATAYVLLGTLPHSSRVRGVLAESADQAHLIEAIHAVLVRLGGTARVWRTDRLSTVIVPGRRDVQPSFAPVAKHYGAVVEPCPPRLLLIRVAETKTATPGGACVTSSTGCMSASSPAPPAPCSNAPTSPPGNRRSCARSRSARRRASSTSTAPRADPATSSPLRAPRHTPVSGRARRSRWSTHEIHA
ncbi:MAG TPA: hypothetical protein VFZ70_14820 [Euzebyales bacterium]